MMHNGESSPPVYGAKGKLNLVVAASLQLLCLGLFFFDRGGIDEIDVHKPQMMQCTIYHPITATQSSKSIYKNPHCWKGIVQCISSLGITNGKTLIKQACYSLGGYKTESKAPKDDVELG
jgi:hypothetical protein